MRLGSDRGPCMWAPGIQRLVKRAAGVWSDTRWSMAVCMSAGVYLHICDNLWFCFDSGNKCQARLMTKCLCTWLGRDTPRAPEQASACLGPLRIDPVWWGMASNVLAVLSCSSIPLWEARSPCGGLRLVSWDDGIMLRRRGARVSSISSIASSLWHELEQRGSLCPGCEKGTWL